jgi:hypothetical protein
MLTLVKFNRLIFLSHLKVFVHLICITIFFYNSCTLVTEPERIYNDKAYPPEFYFYDFDDLEPGQHVDGKIQILFDPRNILYEIEIMRVSLDDSYYKAFHELPYVLVLDTRYYSEGLHKISFSIWQNEKTHGLLNIFDPPSTTFENTLYFDRTPPDKVQLTVVNENNNQIRLNWTESSCPVFYSYLIYKSVNQGAYEYIYSISTRTSTTFIDNSRINLIGADYNYKVAVTTDYLHTFQTESEGTGCKIGNPIIHSFSKYKGGPYINNETSNVNFLIDRKLVSFSTLDNLLIHEMDLSELITQDQYATYVYNNSKSKIYLLNQDDNKLWVINSIDFSILTQTILPDSRNDFYVLDDSRIMFNFGSELKIVDIVSNTILNSVNLSDSVYINSAVVSPDNASLILNWRRNVPNIPTYFYFAEMDITNNNFDLIRLVPIWEQYLRIERSGNKIYCDGKDVFDITTFVRINSLVTDGYVYSFSTYDEKVARIQDGKYNIPGLYEINCNYVSLYRSEGQKLMEWYFIGGYAGYDIQTGYNDVYCRYGKENILAYSLRYGD